MADLHHGCAEREPELVTGMAGNPELEALREAELEALRLEATMALRGPGGRWGTPEMDELNRRIYMPRGPAGLTMMSVDGFKPLADVADTAGNGAVALDPKTVRGFSANPLEIRPGEPVATGITVFDQRNFKFFGTADVANVRALLYDAATKQPVAASDNGVVSLIDPAKLTINASLALDGKLPTALEADRRGRMFVGLADRDGIAVLDMVARKVAATWKPSGCRVPMALLFESLSFRLAAASRGRSGGMKGPARYERSEKVRWNQTANCRAGLRHRAELPQPDQANDRVVRKLTLRERTQFRELAMSERQEAKVGTCGNSRHGGYGP